MYYSYMLGIDTGTEYLIYIYDLNTGEYKYKIIKSQITIVGSTNEEEYDRGIIKSSNDLIKLDNKFINKKENSAELYNSHYRYEKDNAINISNVDELGNQLFNK